MWEFLRFIFEDSNKSLMFIALIAIILHGIKEIVKAIKIHKVCPVCKQKVDEITR